MAVQARSLRSLAEDQVLEELKEATSSLGSPFCVGGSLGSSLGPVCLAVRGTEGGASGACGAAAAVFELPSEERLELLLQQCEHAVFGKGTETVRDPSYRSAQALPADRLFTQRLEAPLATALAAVGTLLLPAAGPLTAQLHKLNVYQTGGFFNTHRDTRGAAGFVASLVLCLPVAHTGGGLRVQHAGRSYTYEWGPGAAAGELQWAVFFPDCQHEVLEVTGGSRVALAFELFASFDAAGAPAPPRALPDSHGRLLGALKTDLDSPSFFVNGGRIDFPCQHAYPQSLLVGVDEKAVRGMLKGDDAAVAAALAALGVPTSLVRVWETEYDAQEYVFLPATTSPDEYARAMRALLVSPLSGGQGKTSRGRATERMGRADFDSKTGDDQISFLEEKAGAKWDTSIAWIGGLDCFPQYTLGTIGYFWGNDSFDPEEFYCSVGIVADIPAFADRPTLSAEAVAWAGRPE